MNLLALTCLFADVDPISTTVQGVACAAVIATVTLFLRHLAAQAELTKAERSESRDAFMKSIGSLTESFQREMAACREARERAEQAGQTTLKELSDSVHGLFIKLSEHKPH